MTHNLKAIYSLLLISFGLKDTLIFISGSASQCQKVERWLTNHLPHHMFWVLIRVPKAILTTCIIYNMCVFGEKKYQINCSNRGIKLNFRFINIHKVPRVVLKTEGEARGFQPS